MQKIIFIMFLLCSINLITIADSETNGVESDSPRGSVDDVKKKKKKRVLKIGIRLISTILRRSGRREMKTLSVRRSTSTVKRS